MAFLILHRNTLRVVEVVIFTEDEWSTGFCPDLTSDCIVDVMILCITTMVQILAHIPNDTSQCLNAESRDREP